MSKPEENLDVGLMLCWTNWLAMGSDTELYMKVHLGKCQSSILSTPFPYCLSSEVTRFLNIRIIVPFFFFLQKLADACIVSHIPYFLIWKVIPSLFPSLPFYVCVSIYMYTHIHTHIHTHINLILLREYSLLPIFECFYCEWVFYFEIGFFSINGNNHVIFKFLYIIY